MISAEDLLKKLDEFRANREHKIVVYFNEPSQKHIMVCEICGTNVDNCPLIK